MPALLIGLLAAVASALPAQPPVKVPRTAPIRKQQLQSPGVIYARVNETETLQTSLGKVLPSRSRSFLADLSASGAVYYRPPRSRLLERVGSANLPSISEQRTRLQDLVVQEGGELRVHTEPKRYLACDKLGLEAWARRIQRHGEFLVVDKPAGVPCAPHVSNGREWLVPFVAAAILASRKQKSNSQPRETENLEDIELVPCNRLDVSTSGLVVLAEDKVAARRFQQLLLDGKVHKRYRALVRGQIFKANEMLEHKISDSVFGKPVPRLIAGMDADIRGSAHKWRDARALIVGVETKNDIQELQIELLTGRTHQLRAQLAGMGSPVMDDTLYKGLSGFIWRDCSDDELAQDLVTSADRGNDAPIGLHCSQLEFEDHVSHAGDPWWSHR